MAGFSKRIAILALAAAGCADSFPPVPGPLDRFYFPVGLAVRTLPSGKTALLVVSTNFDLRYDYDVGGAVVAVEPDDSGDALAGDPTLAVLGGLNIASFGGEVDYLAGSGAGWPNEDPAHACLPLSSQLAPGAAKVVTASRGRGLVYLLDMDAQGGLGCTDCARAPRTEALDPYGVTAVCDDRGTASVVKAYVTHLRAPGNAGYVTEADLRTGASDTLNVGINPTYTGAYSRTWASLFVGSRLGTPVFSTVTWFNVFQSLPAIQAIDLTEVVRDGVLPGKMAFSSDGTLGYLTLDLADPSQWASTGIPISTGGAMGVFDMGPGPFGGPSWSLLRLVPTCLGGGQVDVLPRPPRRDLVAITCPAEGTLLFYDDQVAAVTGRIGLDPVSGKPLLGLQPFGLAHQALPASRCRSGSPCTRLFVGSFDRSWVNVVELDPDQPEGATIVKRLGAERE